MVDLSAQMRQLRAISKWRKAAAYMVAVFTMLMLLAASRPPDEDSQKTARAATLIQTGKLDEAEAMLWDVLTRHPENAEALNLLGSIRLQQKRFAESETLLRRAISLSPDLLPAHMNLARAFHEIAPLKPVLLAAASSADVNVNMLAEAGISEVLRWPFASTELAAALARCLAETFVPVVQRDSLKLPRARRVTEIVFNAKGTKGIADS